MNRFGGFLSALAGVIVLLGSFVKSLEDLYLIYIGGGLALLVGLYLLFNKGY